VIFVRLFFDVLRRNFSSKNAVSTFLKYIFHETSPQACYIMQFVKLSNLQWLELQIRNLK